MKKTFLLFSIIFLSISILPTDMLASNGWDDDDDDSYYYQGEQGYSNSESQYGTYYQETAQQTQSVSYGMNGGYANGTVTSTSTYPAGQYATGPIVGGHHGHAYGHRPRVRTFKKYHPSGRHFMLVTQEFRIIPAHWQSGPYGRVWVPARRNWVTVNKVRQTRAPACGRRF